LALNLQPFLGQRGVLAAPKSNKTIEVCKMPQRSVLVIGLIVLLAASLFAQSEDKPRFFIGYSNFQAEGLPDKNDPNNLLSPAFIDRRTTLHGVNGEVTFPIRNFGITGDFSFNRHDQSADLVNGSQSMKTDIMYFVAGPSFHFRNSTRVEPFVRGMAGGARTNFEIASRRDFTSGTLRNEFDVGSTDLAAMVGGGLDVRVNDKLKVRVFQMDYAPIFLGDRAIRVLGNAGAIQALELEGQRQDHFRFSFGVTF
jgi:opacity protein-like surface antigen